MAEKRQFEVLLVRLVPHALRDDFMTVGVVLVEDSQQPSAISRQKTSHPPSAVNDEVDRGPEQTVEKGAAGGQECPPYTGFAEVRFTRDWKRVECFAPEIESEIFEKVEAAVRESLGEIRSRGDLLSVVGRFGPLFDVGPVKGLVAADPAAEMRILERDYLAPLSVGVAVERAKKLGRLGIVAKMEEAFAEAGVLKLMQRDLEMKEFTGEHDPFRVDFGFRIGKSVKMFHGLALNLSREPAITLAYRYARIQAGMRGRGEGALMTAIISEEAMRAEGEVVSGIAMMRANEITVRGVEEMGEIAEEVRRVVRG